MNKGKRYLKYTLVGYCEITPEMEPTIDECLKETDVAELIEAFHFCETFEASVEVVDRAPE